MGRILAGRFLAAGHTVTAADNLWLDMPDPRENFSCITLDCTDDTAPFLAAESADWIVHAGTVAQHSAPWRELYRQNIRGFNHLCRAAAETGARLLLVGSAGVYGLRREEGPFDESMRLEPTNPLDQSRHIQETLLAKHQRQAGLQAAVIRTARLFGGGVYDEPAQLSDAVANGWLKWQTALFEKIPFPMTHAGDVARLCLFFMENPEALAGGPYNLACEPQMSLLDVIGRLVKLHGVQPPRTLPIPDDWTVKIGKYIRKWASNQARRDLSLRPLFERDIEDFFLCAGYLNLDRLKATGFEPGEFQGVGEF